MSIKSRVLTIVAVMVVMGIALFLAQEFTGEQASEEAITIGGKHFTEQEILGEIMAIMIERNSDLKVVRKLNLGGTMICFNALKGDDLDLYAEYTGTGLVNILRRQAISDPDRAYETVRKAFKEKYNLLWLKSFGFNNTYTLTMRRGDAEKLGIETISGLAKQISDGAQLRAAFDAEFLVRADGYRGLSKTYGFKFPNEPKQMDPGLMYKAIANGAVDVIDGFATDGRIPAYGLLVLKDDKNFFPPYYAAPLVRAEVLKEHPKLAEILNQLAGKISDDTMQSMNYEVDEKGRKAYDVALEFLLSQGLIAPEKEKAER